MESIVKVKHMDLTYQSMKEHEDVMITELEGLLEDATPSEAEICTEKLHELHELFDADAPELARLQSLGWHDLNAEEKLAGKSFTVEYFDNTVQIILMKYKFYVS